jgi:hypothetical protein
MEPYAPLCAVFLAGFFGLALIAVVMWNRGVGFGPMSVKLFGLVFVAWIAALVYVIPASHEHAEALMTLLGTIAGYLIGRSAKADEG